MISWRAVWDSKSAGGSCPQATLSDMMLWSTHERPRCVNNPWDVQPFVLCSSFPPIKQFCRTVKLLPLSYSSKVRCPPPTAQITHTHHRNQDYIKTKLCGHHTHTAKANEQITLAQKKSQTELQNCSVTCWQTPHGQKRPAFFRQVNIQQSLQRKK